MRGVARFPGLPGILGALFMGAFLLPSEIGGQTAPPVGREAAMRLTFEKLDFRPPEARKLLLDGEIPVLFLEDHTLPMVTLYARFRGGFALLPKESYAAATALAGLMRSGGTASLSPDSVDHLVDFYALQTTFGGGGESTFSNVNTLTKHLRPVIRLWGEILRSPRFDPREVAIWRDRELESIRRRKDDPGGLAFSEFNRIMFGDHPIGWEIGAEDLTPERFSPQAVEEVHRRIFCPQNLILGAVGDVKWEELEPLLREMVAHWPPCTGSLQEAALPEVREGPAVFLIPRDLPQSTVVLAHAGGITQESGPDYYASRIGNSILGSSGFTSRLVARVRTERGWAYSASSLWTAPARHEGILGAVTQTKSETTMAAIDLILSTIQEMREEAPSDEEVERAVAQIVNGSVFNFQDPGQIVARQMFYLAEGLREDWFEDYLKGIQEVSATDVLRVFQAHARPEEMVILILGNPSAFDAPAERLGELRIWDPDTGTVRGNVPGSPLSEPPRGGRRSPL